MSLKIKSILLLFSLLMLSTHQCLSAERDAETLFNEFCFACHGTGWEDAPVIGDSFAWEDRLKKGLQELVNNTINGINAMPPKGTCNDCSEAEIKAVVRWLIGDQ